MINIRPVSDLRNKYPEIEDLVLREDEAVYLTKNVHSAIEQRSKSPESYEIYKGKANMKYDWYRIYIGNYTIFYTVRNSIMEITHIFYSARNFDNII